MLSFLSVRDTAGSSVERKYRVKHSAERLEFGLNIIFLSLQLGEAQMPRIAVGNGGAGLPRGHSRGV